MNKKMRILTLQLDVMNEAIEYIERYLAGVSKEAFMQDALLQDAVCLRMMVIGESASKLRNKLDFDTKYPEIDWFGIAGLRNIIAHEYDIVDMEIIWKIVHKRLPALKKFLARSDIAL